MATRETLAKIGAHHLAEAIREGYTHCSDQARARVIASVGARTIALAKVLESFGSTPYVLGATPLERCVEELREHIELTVRRELGPPQIRKN